MADPTVSLALANAGFVGTHFLMSHPLRAGMVKALGEKGFLGVYSLVSLAFLVWVVLAFRAAEPFPLLWNGPNTVIWIVASLLTILALVLLLGSLKGNPALPETTDSAVASAEATGVFKVTRHPMMWGFGLWALSHILVWPSPRTLITAGAMGVLALVGAHLQDRKKERLLGGAWQGWEAKTNFWPKIGELGSVGWRAWLHGIAAWLIVTWFHGWIGNMPVGAFRWIG